MMATVKVLHLIANLLFYNGKYAQEQAYSVLSLLIIFPSSIL